MVDISASPPWGPSGHEIQIWSTYPIHPFHHGQQIASLAPARRPHSPGTLQNPIEDEGPRPRPPRKCRIGCKNSSLGYKDGCPDKTPSMSWGYLGGLSWGASEAVLGSSWGGSWTVRLGGASWVLLGHLGHFLGRLEPMLAHPENMFVVCLGAFRTSQEPSDWGLVARALAPSDIKPHCPHQIHS